MNTATGKHSKELWIKSQQNRINIDTQGSAISGVKMDADFAYGKIPELLQSYINDNDTSAWEKIRDKIDYIYTNITYALNGLENETGFSAKIRAELNLGKKLLFKPNLLAPFAIDEDTHGEGLGEPYCTQWPFTAAVMRWFHDILGISYFQMSIGEASPYINNLAYRFYQSTGNKVPTESVIEGKCGDFCGGWGFYFVRLYLAEYHASDHPDNPMKGYEESRDGRYIPPGRAGDRLMVYDLNKLQDDITKRRTVPVPDGINFKEITIHKAVIGGDPKDREDVEDYPGCILVNLPRLKMHAQDLITNAIKNLGIGLYPTLSAEGEDEKDTHWKYAYPYTAFPNLKAKLPHSPWVVALDDNLQPMEDEHGDLLAAKTAGFSGTQTDIIKAVQSQGVFMLHVVDAITVLNISHDPTTPAQIIPEGFVWTSLDCVAIDQFCANYCFNTIPMEYTRRMQKENDWPTDFVRHVPVAYISGQNISTKVGIDSPLFLYHLYHYAQKRGIGQRSYYITGWNSMNGNILVSVEGHLGELGNGDFKEMLTKTMYYNPMTILHDLQLTMLSYAKATDILTGSCLYQELMECFDENGDGMIDYDEKGMGFETCQLCVMSYSAGLQLSEAYGSLRGNFLGISYFAKYGDRKYNPKGYDYMKGKILIGGLELAYKMSQSGDKHTDLYYPEITYGRGNWPSWKTVLYMQTTAAIFGSQTKDNISLGSLYGLAFQYADKVQNAGAYTGSIDQDTSDQSSVRNYLKAVASGEKLLNFTLYVPVGYGCLEGIEIPNVKESRDPIKIYTAQFELNW